MAKSKQSFEKRQREINRKKHKQDKQQKMEERKANTSKATSLHDMLAYIDEDGNLSSTPPDRKKPSE